MLNVNHAQTCVKNFLIQNFGLENISAFTVIDDESVAFRIRAMMFMLDLTTMSIKRELHTPADGVCIVSTSVNDDCVAVIEKSLKKYMNQEIERLSK